MKIIILLLILSSCTTGYVLHSAKKPGFLCKYAESSKIVSQNKITVLYARDPIVILAPITPEGDTVVHYTLSIKNNRKSSIVVKIKEVTLNAENMATSKAYFNKDKRVKNSFTVKSQELFNVSIAFEIPKAVIERYEDSVEPLIINIPIQNEKSLKLKVWLWEV